MTLATARQVAEHQEHIQADAEELWDGDKETHVLKGIDFEAKSGEFIAIMGRSGAGKSTFLYQMSLLDEPTTGLHFHDVKKLLEVLNRLVDKGNSIVVIEHNLDVIKTADWIVDLGPEGGERGGRILCEGTPESISKSKLGFTAKFLAQALQQKS